MKEEKSRAGRKCAAEVPFDKINIEYFINKFSKLDSGCWQWTAYIDPAGYGRFAVGSGRKESQTMLAHRVSYVLFKGINPPSDAVLDHTCRNRACVNPDHLEVVSCAENIRRGIGIEKLKSASRAMGERTHCKRGHPFSGDNVVYDPRQRRCRTCARENTRARRERCGIPHRRILKNEEIVEIRALLSSGLLTQAEIGNRFGVDQGVISKINKRKRIFIKEYP